jgi:hypothetical protein
MPWTELHEAAEAGADSDARAAITAGVDVNSIDDGEQSALHRACGFGRHTTAEILLEAGADIDARDDVSAPPISRFFSLGSLARASLTCTHTPCHSSRHSHVPPLLSPLFSRSPCNHGHMQSGSTPLHLAAWKGQVATVEVLVSARADLDSKGTCVQEVCMHGCASVPMGVQVCTCTGMWGLAWVGMLYARACIRVCACVHACVCVWISPGLNFSDLSLYTSAVSTSHTCSAPSLQGFMGTRRCTWLHHTGR